MSKTKVYKKSKSIIQKLDDWNENFCEKLLPGERRGFISSIVLSIGVALVVNSHWGVMSSIGGVIFVIGFFLSPLKDNIFWPRISVAFGLPMIAYGANNIQYSMLWGVTILTIGILFSILGISLFFINTKKK